MQLDKNARTHHEVLDDWGLGKIIICVCKNINIRSNLIDPTYSLH